MEFKRFARRIPQIARRDATIRDLKAENRRLRAKLTERATRRSAPRRQKTTAPPSMSEQASMVETSGLFDRAWYREQLAATEVPDPLVHYLTQGYRDGLSPHPCFDPEWYAAQPGVRLLSGSAPLLHYLQVGARAKRSPHPGFHPVHYSAAHPESLAYPGGPMAHFVIGPHTAPAPAVLAGSGLTDPGDYLAAATAAARSVREARGTEHLPRESATFDHDAAEVLKRELRADSSLLDPAPLVSVVLPTEHRAGVVPAAVASVVAQTYPHWELIIVDDGGQDETAEALADLLQDERIRLVRHSTSRGVAAARNTGLEHASGEYVAYLDSDNTWLPDFLETLVGFARQEGAAVVYSASALAEGATDGRRRYRGMQFSRRALRERNYIDCIAVLHERRLIEATGGFDETLQRNVDWDFLIRLADVANFRYVPVIGTQYDLWESGTGRITTDEPASYRYLVCQRTLIDWREAEATTRGKDLVSVVVVAHSDVIATVATVRRARETANRPVDVVVVDSKLTDADATRLHLGLWALPDVRVLRLSQELPIEVTRNVGACAARGDSLVFLTEHMWTEPGWLGPLLDGLNEYSTVAPVLLERNGVVWSAGAQAVRGAGVPAFCGMPGDAPEVRGARAVFGVSATCVAVRTANFLAVEGYDPLYVQDYVTPDLSVRLARHTARPPGVTGDSTVALRALRLPGTRASSSVRAVDNERRFAAAIEAEVVHDDATNEYDVAWWERDAHERLVASLVHARPDRPLRWAIKICAPNVERRAVWGDWHFAVALRDSLERLGHEVVIDCRNAWYRPTTHLDDVTLMLRGTRPYRVNPSHINVSWVISHPDAVPLAELGDYDLVFGAAPRWCDAVASRTTTPVVPLRQCTDHRRFAPGPPDLRRQHEVLVVANGRGMRPSVAAAIAGGYHPAVYGAQWDDLLPENTWQAENLPNHELPGVYRAAGVVLNDHWEDMLRDGLISNRLFDLAACEARVVSDYTPDIDEVFDGALPTYRRPQDLPDTIRHVLNDTVERQEARRELGELVRREHTFDVRARTISDAVLQLRRERS